MKITVAIISKQKTQIMLCKFLLEVFNYRSHNFTYTSKGLISFIRHYENLGQFIFIVRKFVVSYLMSQCFIFPRYELWKPYLRSKMECDTKEVCVGSKTKSEVLETCLQQMKACFLDVCSWTHYRMHLYH